MMHAHVSHLGADPLRCHCNGVVGRGELRKQKQEEKEKGDDEEENKEIKM